MQNSRMITLRHDGFELGLLPGTGGAVAHFKHQDANLLRPATGRAPTDMAAFPLFPFSGRIGNGRFRWQGRDIQLDQNFPPEPHAIHGQSWLAEWDVVSATSDRALLRYVHAADAWPWAYRAEQLFRLGPNGLVLELSITNLSNETMPAGIGWHPYFPSAGAEIEADTTVVWETGPDMLPRPPRPPMASEQLREGAPIAELSLDTPFTTASRPVTIRWPEHRRMLRMLPDELLRFLIVYTPPGEEFFCAEPVSHVPDMVNLAAPASETGLVALTPGETLKGAVRLELSPLATGSAEADDGRVPAR